MEITSEIKIEKGIPIPSGQKALSEITKALRNMNSGDSFLMPTNRIAVARNAASNHQIKIITKSQKDGTTRVWKK